MAVNGYEYFPEGNRFYAAFVDDTRRGFWGVFDDQVWDGTYIGSGLTKDQAIYGVTLLENGAIPLEDVTEVKDELAHMVALVVCDICEKHAMRAQMRDGRCPGCQP